MWFRSFRIHLVVCSLMVKTDVCVDSFDTMRNLNKTLINAISLSRSEEFLNFSVRFCCDVCVCVTKLRVAGYNIND